MLAYAVHINPLAHSDDVVICFDAPPTKQQVIAVLAGLVAGDAHPSGVSAIARCIEAVEQHGLPDLQRHNGKFEWRLPKPMPHWRYGKISIEEFEIYPIAENPKSEIRNPNEGGGEKVAACGDNSNFERVLADEKAKWIASQSPAAAIAALKAADAIESDVEPIQPGETIAAAFARLGIRERLRAIVANIRSSNVESGKVATGLMETLLADVVKLSNPNNQ